MLDARDIVVGAEVVVTDHLGRRWSGVIHLEYLDDGHPLMSEYQVEINRAFEPALLRVQPFAPLPFRDIEIPKKIS